VYDIGKGLLESNSFLYFLYCFCLFRMRFFDSSSGGRRVGQKGRESDLSGDFAAGEKGDGGGAGFPQARREQSAPGGVQHIRGSGSPLRGPMIRRPPMAVFSMTLPVPG